MAVSLEIGPGRPASSRSRTTPYLTLGERAARGKATRADVARGALGEWQPPANRRNPVDLLEEQAATRLQDLVPLRYGRMLVSPFTYYRGAAYPMAADLALAPRTGLHVQLCGDAHLSNFGGFAAPDRRQVFGVNDFDETLPGPFEWDVKRLAASFAVAGRDRGFNMKERRGVNTAVGQAYRDGMAEFAQLDNLELWYARVGLEDVQEQVLRAGLDRKQLKRFEKNLAKSQAKDSMRAFGKLTETVDGRRRIASDPPLIVPVEELAPGAEGEQIEEYVRGVLHSYRRTLTADRRRLLERFQYIHAARKVVGVGSVGTRAFIMLLLGRDDDDPLFLQLKEAQSSVLEPFLGRSAYANSGQRVVEGQRLMQAASDIMLGWIRVPDLDGVKRDLYIRQLWDQKGSAIVEAMDPHVMGLYAELCGKTLAKAHARSGDAVAIASYLGSGPSFDRAMAEFAEAYADQNERDYRELERAVASGRLRAETGY